MKFELMYVIAFILGYMISNMVNDKLVEGTDLGERTQRCDSNYKCDSPWVGKELYCTLTKSKNQQTVVNKAGKPAPTIECRSMTGLGEGNVAGHCTCYNTAPDSAYSLGGTFAPDKGGTPLKKCITAYISKQTSGGHPMKQKAANEAALFECYSNSVSSHKHFWPLNKTDQYNN
jgi:hypothetical protein